MQLKGENPIYPCLWFEHQALEAARFYCSVFRNSRILSSNETAVEFELGGTRFMALNGKKNISFNESVSFVRTCRSQEEIDHCWELLSDGGEEQMCGWLRDRYGVSWQIIPEILGSLMSDPVKGQQVIKALLTMKKINLEALLRI